MATRQVQIHNEAVITVYLTNGGVPVTDITYDDVKIFYKKARTEPEELDVTSENFREIHSTIMPGLYEIVLPATVLDVEGDFILTVISEEEEPASFETIHTQITVEASDKECGGNFHIERGNEYKVPLKTTQKGVAVDVAASDVKVSLVKGDGQVADKEISSADWEPVQGIRGRVMLKLDTTDTDTEGALVIRVERKGGAGWEEADPILGDTITAMEQGESGYVYAGANQIIRSSDGGVTWEDLGKGGWTSTQKATTIKETTFGGILVGLTNANNTHRLYYWDTSGWVNLTQGHGDVITGTVLDIHSSGDGNYWIAASDGIYGRIFVYNGTSVTREFYFDLTTSAANRHRCDTIYSTGNVVWAAGGLSDPGGTHAGVIKGTWTGSSWDWTPRALDITAFFPVNVMAVINQKIYDLEIDPNNDNVMWLSGEVSGSPILIKTVDGGDTWSSVSSPGIGLVQYIKILDGGDVVVSTKEGSLKSKITRDGGATWEDFGPTEDASLRGIHVSGLARVYAYGDAGKIVYMSDPTPFDAQEITTQVIREDISSNVFQVVQDNKNMLEALEGNIPVLTTLNDMKGYFFQPGEHSLVAIAGALDGLDVNVDLTSVTDSLEAMKGPDFIPDKHSLEALGEAVTGGTDLSGIESKLEAIITRLEGIEGEDFDQTAASLVEIKDAISNINLSPVVTSLDEIKGQGFDEEEHSLVKIAESSGGGGGDLTEIENRLEAIEEMVIRVLGLSQENISITEQQYDGHNNLTSSVITTYANNLLDPEDPDNVIATYKMEAEYDENQRLSAYRIRRIQ